MTGDKRQIVAALHDVCEDTEITIEDLLKEGLSKEIVDAVDAITRREGEAYTEYIARCKNNEIARDVKIGDINDNMDLSRLQTVTDRDLKRNERYKLALGFLTA